MAFQMIFWGVPPHFSKRMHHFACFFLVGGKIIWMDIFWSPFWARKALGHGEVIGGVGTLKGFEVITERIVFSNTTQPKLYSKFHAYIEYIVG